MPGDQQTRQVEQLPRGRHRLSRETVARSQRERTLRAMLEAVAERGFAETRVVDVIERAGLSRKTFYELFGDKEECFLAAYDEVSARLYAVTEEAFESAAGEPWPERIRAGVTALVEELAADQAAARFAVIEVLAAGPRALARRDAAIRQFTGFIDAGRSESTLELPGLTSTAIVGGIYELLYSEILHGATSQIPARVPEIVYWITQPFLGPERAAEERDRARGALPARA
jgi:AcrR family transcriptional regulator